MQGMDDFCPSVHKFYGFVMRKFILVLWIGFTVLTFADAGYVLYTGGRENPGIAVISAVFAFACSQGYHALKKRK